MNTDVASEIARLESLLVIEERAERAALSLAPNGNKYSRTAAERATQIRERIAAAQGR